MGNFKETIRYLYINDRYLIVTEENSVYLTNTFNPDCVTCDIVLTDCKIKEISICHMLKDKGRINFIGGWALNLLLISFLKTICSKLVKI